MIKNLFHLSPPSQCLNPPPPESVQIVLLIRVQRTLEFRPGAQPANRDGQDRVNHHGEGGTNAGTLWNA